MPADWKPGTYSPLQVCEVIRCAYSPDATQTGGADDAIIRAVFRHVDAPPLLPKQIPPRCSRPSERADDEVEMEQHGDPPDLG